MKVVWDVEIVIGSIDVSWCSIEVMCFFIYGGIECYVGCEINFMFFNYLVFRFFL